MRSIVNDNKTYNSLLILVFGFGRFFVFSYSEKKIILGEFYALVLLRQVVTRPNVIKASLNKASCNQGKLL